jgi:hypothetical protein
LLVIVMPHNHCFLFSSTSRPFEKDENHTSRTQGKEKQRTTCLDSIPKSFSFPCPFVVQRSGHFSTRAKQSRQKEIPSRERDTRPSQEPVGNDLTPSENRRRIGR